MRNPIRTICCTSMTVYGHNFLKLVLARASVRISCAKYGSNPGACRRWWVYVSCFRFVLRLCSSAGCFGVSLLFRLPQVYEKSIFSEDGYLTALQNLGASRLVPDQVGHHSLSHSYLTVSLPLTLFEVTKIFHFGETNGNCCFTSDFDLPCPIQMARFRS